jgi:hypothetical protein
MASRDGNMKTSVDLLKAIENLSNASKLLDALADSIYNKTQQAKAYDVLDLVNDARVYLDHLARQ